MVSLGLENPPWWHHLVTMLLGERNDLVPVWICIQSACVTLGVQNKTGEETSGKIFYRATLRPSQRRSLMESSDGFSLNLVIHAYAVLGNAITPFRCISTIMCFQHGCEKCDILTAHLLQLQTVFNVSPVRLHIPAWPDLDSIDGCLDLSFL